MYNFIVRTDDNFKYSRFIIVADSVKQAILTAKYECKQKGVMLKGIELIITGCDI